MTKVRLALTVAVLAVSSSKEARAGDPGPTQLPSFLRLDDAVHIFRQRGLDLLLADAAVRSAEGDLRAAAAVPNPSWTAGYFYSFYDDNLFSSHQGWQVGLGDSNAIEDALSGKRRLRIKVARAALQAARMSRADTQRLLEFEVKSAYLQAVLASELLGFSREVQTLSQRSYELSRLRRQTGAISPVDEMKMLGSKLEADQAVDGATRELRAAKVLLAFWLGVRGPVPDFAIEQNLPPFRIPDPLAHATRDSLLREALDHRPDLKAAAYQRDRAAASIQLSRRLVFPDVGLNVLYQQQGSPAGGCFSPLVRDSSGQCRDVMSMMLSTPTAPVMPPTLQLTLSGTIPLFYQQQGEIRKAQADYSTQVLNRAKAEAQLVSDVETALADFAASRALVERLSAQLLPTVRFVLDKTELEYRAGKASLLEYLDARRQYVAVSVEYYQDLSRYWTAVLELERAVGGELR